ncbi:MAG: shikimate dehydrogenase [Blautia sp.]|nr:shikimate dehydrogenase [Blautia sp.]
MSEAKNYRAELTACFGNPVDENPTGIIEEAGYNALDLNYRYLTIKVDKEDLPAAVAGARAMGFRGFNLTIPHKIAVIPLLDELTVAARITGAVNTVINKDGKLTGENTDGKGFLTSLLQKGIDPKGKKITILGAGGAARAVSVELALAGASHIYIINRNEARGEELSRTICEKTGSAGEYIRWEKGIGIPEDTDIIVQATNIGLYPDVTGKPDICYDSLKPEMTACDVVFNRPDTPFLKEAEKRGLMTINGLGMLVNQAAMNFRLWTGCEAPVDIMTEALETEFGL